MSVATSFAASPIDLRLVEAARQGNKDAVRSLLNQHAMVNTPQPDGATALEWAVYRDDFESAELLIEAGAKVNMANDYGITPLDLACNNRSVDMVAKLMNAGAKPMPAAVLKCIRTGNLEGVKLLLAHGADVNAREARQGQTALMWAVAERHSDVAQELIAHGADIHARSKGGFTPLLFAAQQGDLDTIRLLLAAGANVNEVTAEGDTPLLVASASGHESTSIFLIEHGADPNAADENGFTALHYSLIKGLALLCRVRIEKPYERPRVPHLVRPNMVELMKYLLAHGANPNARVKLPPTGNPPGDKLGRVSDVILAAGSVSPVGATAFLMAAATYDADAMRILVAGGADPLLTTKENVTALMLTAGLNRSRTTGPLAEEEEIRALESAKAALEFGIDVNAADNRLGLTALHGAAFHGSSRIVQFLAEKGANLEAKDILGQTPLDKAANIQPKGTDKNVDAALLPLRAHKSTADLLLQLGAKPSDPVVADTQRHGP